jgi:hypothetical protein
MSAPPSVRQIAREALKDAPGWLDGLLQPLNTFLRQAVDLLSGNLTVSENLAQAWLEVTVSDGVATPPVIPALKGRVPKGVTVEKVATLGTGGTPGVAPSGPVTVLWEPTTLNGRPAIRITNVTGMATGGRYNITLLVKAE